MTVRQPFTEMGATAAKLVLALAAGQPLDQGRVEIATTLIVRESTAPPPQVPSRAQAPSRVI